MVLVKYMANILKKGDRFNNLEFIEIISKRTNDNHLIGRFKCNCGIIKEIVISRVVNGYTKTCGNNNHKTGINIKHGKKGSSTYNVWTSMKQRCLNNNNKNYKYYGAKGISIDKKWYDFENFYKDMGDKPKNKSLDRIDNKKGYSKDNCRWSTNSEQQTNKKNTKVIIVDGKKFIGWTSVAKYYGVSVNTVIRRCKGYVDKRRINTPSKGILKANNNYKYYELYN